jgi:diguanylate cyclase
MQTPLVELALNRPQADAGTAAPADRRTKAVFGFADRLLRLFGSAIPEPSRPTHTRFGERIETWRARIRSTNEPETLEVIATEILAECTAHADRFHEDLGQREAEVSDLMGVLRGVIEALRGDSRQFEAELQRSTESMRKMVDVEDIREIKRVLTQEVDAICKASTARQAAESKRVETLTAQVESLRSNLREARLRALTDALTGVPNRGAFEEELHDSLTRASWTRTGFCLAMVDLDDLKLVNDTHGHQVGDRVLIACARILQESISPRDFVARYGGEEFAVILQRPSLQEGAAVLQAALGRIPPTYKYTVDRETKGISFSFSAGVALWAPGDSGDAVLKRADDALYDAKRRGKKRVETRERGLIGNLVGWASPGRRAADAGARRPSPHESADSHR